MTKETAEAILETIQFVDSESFHEKGAEEKYAQTFPLPTIHYCPTLTKDIKNPIMDREQEKLVFLCYNYAKYRLVLLQDKPYTESLLAEVERWQNQKVNCREYIARHNTALIPAMAVKFCRNKYGNFADYLSEGDLYFTRSIDSFNAERGIRFNTWACNSIIMASQYQRRYYAKWYNRHPTVTEIPEVQDESDSFSGVEEEDEQAYRKKVVEYLLNHKDMEKHVPILKRLFIDQVKNADLAREWGWTRQTVSYRMKLALQQAKKVLAEYEPGLEAEVLFS